MSLWDTSFQRGASLNQILSSRRIRVVQVFVSQPDYLHSPTFLFYWILIYQKYLPSPLQRRNYKWIVKWSSAEISHEVATTRSSPLSWRARFLRPVDSNSNQSTRQNAAANCTRWREGHGGGESPPPQISQHKSVSQILLMGLTSHVKQVLA